MMKSLFATALATVLLAGCAAPQYAYRPVVDTRGVNSAQYAADDQNCAAYAAQVDRPGNTVGGAAIGAIGGAILGSLIGGGRATRNMAAAGAVAGGVISNQNAEVAQQNLYNQCMVEKGHTPR